MGRRKSNRRRYSDDDRANALAALAANGGSIPITAEQLGIPVKTLRSWVKGERHPEAAHLCHEKKGPLADRLEEVAWMLADAIQGKLDKAPLQQVTTSLGIVIDKVQLLRGQPTNINRSESDDLRNLTTEELEQRLAELEGRGGGEGRVGATEEGGGDHPPAEGGGDPGRAGPAEELGEGAGRADAA